MSSILKALKKLEDEKTVRKPDSLNIDAEILRGDTSSRFSLLGGTLVAALIFVCGVGAAYVYMKKPLSGQAEPRSAIAPPAAPSPAVIVPAAKVLQQDAAPLKPVQQAQQPAMQPQQKAAATAHSAKAPVAKPQPKPQSIQPPKPVAVARTAKPAQQAANAVRTTAPGSTPVIKVNGIAFQDGSSDSVAVVNGVPVSNGSVVEGARVEDIQRDRVRFSYGGEKFEVPLGKSNR